MQPYILKRVGFFSGLGGLIETGCLIDCDFSITEKSQIDTVQKPPSRRGGKRVGAGRKRKYPAPALADFEHNLFDHNAALRIAECGRLLIAAGRALLGSEREI